MKIKRKRIWIPLVIILILLIVTGGVLLTLTVPNVETQLGNLKPAILVAISEPVNGQKVLPGDSLSVYVSVASAQPLQSLEVFADGTPLAIVMSTSLEQSPVTAMFLWSPVPEGWHLLTARATDQDGFTVLSNPIRVEAILPPAPQPVEPTLLDKPGVVLGISTDSPDFETELDTEIERLLSLATDQEPVHVQVPSFTAPDLEVPPESFTGSILEAPSSAPFFQKFLLWTSAKTSTSVILPQAPSLRGSVEDCTVRLRVYDRSNNELGFHLYRLGPLDTGWVLEADLQASDGTGVFEYLDSDRNNGKQDYYIASYNAAGENPGNIIELNVAAEACSIHSPHVVSLQNAFLTPTQPVDRLYCYASNDLSSWVRIPRKPQEFINPVEGVFNLSPYLHGLGVPGTPLQFKLECWGWHGETLVSLGSGSGPIGAAEGPLEFNGDRYRLRADSILDPMNPGDQHLAIKAIVPPVNLHYSTSLADCHVFSGGDAAMEWACENLIDPWTGESVSGHNILVWHYYDFCKYNKEYCQGYIPFSEVRGYHVYRQTKNALEQWNEPILIKTVDRNDVLMAVLTPGETTSASDRTRYFVRAFVQDGYESGDSNYLQPVSANFKMTIPALYSQANSVRVFKPGGKVVGVDVEPGPQGSTKNVDNSFIGDGTYWVSGEPVQEEQTEEGFLVGYLRSHAKHLPKSISMIFDDWIQFDLSQVPGKITNATLRWDGDLIMAGPGWDKWSIWCGNELTTFYGWPVDYMEYLLPSDDIWGVDVTNLVLLQQQAEASHTSVGGLTPYYFGFYMWSGMRTHYTTEYFWDACLAQIKNVRLEVEYTE